MSLKRDKICPHCQCRKRWHVERVRLYPRQPLPISLELRFAGASLALGGFEALICAECGFTEWYGTGLAELKHDPAAGVYFIDDEPKAGLR